MQSAGGLGLLDGPTRGMDVRFGRHIGLLAVGAQAAGEPLGDNPGKGGRHQEGLDPHFDEAHRGGCSAVGVKGGENHVPGERGFDGDRGRLLVADLADQDDVGVGAQNGT